MRSHPSEQAHLIPSVEVKVVWLLEAVVLVVVSVSSLWDLGYGDGLMQVHSHRKCHHREVLHGPDEQRQTVIWVGLDIVGWIVR